nr:PREDICTED: tRNA (cytosine(38)-C(5))-methyltransferase [Paralichthys olivaceus]
MESLRVLELYSGIGGMHYALKESGIPGQVVAAIDINTTTNQIYRHNFPDTPLWNKTIEGIPLDDFNKLSFDMILMSPPCQPFTRIGLQGDIHDLRTKSFLYILDVLPSFAMISDAHAHPSESDSSELPTDLCPTCPSTCQLEEDMQGGRVLYKLETAADVQQKRNQNSNLSVRQIQDFLEPQMEANLENFLLPPKTLLRYALLLDIVQPSSRRSVCFTKGYGRYVEGTGSVLQSCMETEVCFDINTFYDA